MTVPRAPQPKPMVQCAGLPPLGAGPLGFRADWRGCADRGRLQGLPWEWVGSKSIPLALDKVGLMWEYPFDNRNYDVPLTARRRTDRNESAAITERDRAAGG